MKPCLYLPLLAALGTACHSASTSSSADASGKPDVLQAALDTTVAPGDDFFTYANGTWLKNHPIPASESSWGIGRAVQNEVYAQLRRLSQQAAGAQAAAGSAQQKIGDFWAVGLDSVRADGLGAQPIEPELARIAALKSVGEVPGEIARLLPLGVNALVSVEVAQDDKNSAKMAVHLWQDGIGLPNRDYYFNTDARTRRIRAQYVRHVAATFRLLGQDSVVANANAARVMKLETTLARSSRKLEALRDPYANYHKLSVAQLGQLAPAISWPGWLRGVLRQQVDTVIVGQPEFCQAAGRLLQTAPLADWQAYLSWQLTHKVAPALGRRFDQEHFHFYGTVLHGAQSQRPRWKRVLDMEEEALGDASGNLHEWWTKADRRRFQQRVAGIVRQFSSYTALDSLHLNGRATAGENIADLGGIVIGLDAFKKTRQYQAGRKIGGLTPVQRYFLGYALGWQDQQRQEALAAQILTDVHSPAQYRVNGPLADVPEFYQAFGVKPGQKLYRPDSARVKIW